MIHRGSAAVGAAAMNHAPRPRGNAIAVVRNVTVPSGRIVPVAITHTGEGTISPRSLTPEELTLIGVIASLAATVAAKEGAPSALTVEITLVAYLFLREFTRRFLPPTG